MFCGLFVSGTPGKSNDCDGSSVIQEAIEHAVFVKLDLCLGKEELPLKPMG